MNIKSNVMTRKTELLHISDFTEKQQINNNAGKNKAELADNVQISDEAQELYQRNILAVKKIESFRELPLRLLSISEKDIKEIPPEYLVETHMKMPLKVEDGSHNIFEDYTESQYEVFSNYLLSRGLDSEFKKVMESVKKNIDPMDYLNSLEGYRGTSIKSIALVEGSAAALYALSESMLPENFKEGFVKLVKEYKDFNTKSREVIANSMTPDFTVLSDENGKASSYIYKEEMFQRKQKTYGDVTDYFSHQFGLINDNKVNDEAVNNIFNDITKHLHKLFTDKYKNARNKEKLIRESVTDIMNNIRKIW